ncbi:MAG: WG repeat-containing protein [Cyclobacteriaceae bacterium]
MRPFLFALLLLSSVHAFGADFYRYEENGRVGIKNSAGQVVIPASFDGLGWADGSFSVIGEVTGYRLKERWGLINLKKELITGADYESLVYGNGNFVVATKSFAQAKQYVGVINLRGQVVIPFEYEGVWLQGLRAIVTRIEKGRWLYGVLTTGNETVLPTMYKSIKPIGTLRFAVENFEGKRALYTEEGKGLTDFVIDSIGHFLNGYAIVYAASLQGLMSRDGNLELPIEYRDIRFDESTRAWWTRSPDQWSLLDLHNQVVRKVEGDQLSPLNSHFIRISMQGLSGLLDHELNLVWPIRYREIPQAVDSIVLVRQKRFGLLGLHEEIIMPVEFDSLILEGHCARALHTEYGVSSWSLYNLHGHPLANGKYERMLPLEGEHFQIRSRGHWGLLRQDGTETVHCVYDEISQRKGSGVVVKFHGETGIIDLNENWKVTPQRWPLELVNDSLYLRREDSTTFLLNYRGDLIYFTKNAISIALDGLRERMPDETVHIITFSGVDLSAPPVEVRPVRKKQILPRDHRKETVSTPAIAVFPASEGFRRIRKDEKAGFLDQNGRLRVANRYDDAMDFHEGVAGVKVVGKWGFINQDDQFVVQPAYDTVFSFIQGLALVRRANRYGLVQPDGSVALPMRYDSIQRLPSGRYRLYLEGAVGLADARGKLFIDPRFESIEDLNNGFLVVRQHGLAGLVDETGISVIPLQYDQLTFDAAGNRFLALRRSQWKRWLH